MCLGQCMPAGRCIVSPLLLRQVIQVDIIPEGCPFTDHEAHAIDLGVAIEHISLYQMNGLAMSNPLTLVSSVEITRGRCKSVQR